MIGPNAAKSFPKSARLRKSSDFKFYPFQKEKTPSFTFVYCTRGEGRLGISISKKVLKNAAARNRVKRLVRETFRHRVELLGSVDVHVIGAPCLTDSWSQLKRQDVENQFDRWMSRLG